MQIKFNYLGLIVAIVLSNFIFSIPGHAYPLITIIPNDFSYHESAVPLGSTFVVPYTIINNTPVTLTNISASHLPVGVTSTTCASLAANGGSCILNLLIPTQIAGSVAGQFQVCVINDNVGCTAVAPIYALNIAITNTSTLLAITDMHVKNWDNTPINYGEDTGSQLWNSALQELSTLITQQLPKFILLLGDLPAHNDDANHTTNMATVLTNLSGLNEIVNNETPVFYAFGNNDSLVEDYGPFYNGTQNLFYLDPTHTSPTTKGWPTLNANPDCTLSPTKACTYTTTSPMPPQHASDMANANVFCYYSAYPLGSTMPLRLIVLNSVIFSFNYRGATQLTVAQNQMDWLAQQLAAANANNESVYIAMHIPVGTNAFSQGDDMWNDTLILNNGLRFRDAFLVLVNQYKNNIRAIFTGHTHFNEFRALYANTALTQLTGIDFGVPAVSPIFGNNSAMQIYLYDATYQLVEAKTFFTTPNPAVWNRYSFQNDYACSDVSTMSLCIQQRILNNLNLWKSQPQPIPNNPYEMNYATRSPVFDPTIGGFSSWLLILNTIQTLPIS